MTSPVAFPLYEIVEERTLPPPSPVLSNKWEIAESLRERLDSIEVQRRSALSPKKFVWTALPIFLQVWKKERLATSFKCLAISLSILLLESTFYGSLACLSTYRMKNYTDLYSSDLAVASEATILFSNTGQGITFLIEGVTCSVLPAFSLLKNVYDQAQCQSVAAIYNDQILQVESDQQREFLYEEANRALAPCRGYLAETEEIETIMQEIEQEKATRLSTKNLICIMVSQLVQNACTSPLKTIAKVSLFGIAALCLHPLIIGTIGCMNGHRLRDPNDLFSSDSNTLSNAFDLFSNTGHTMEYLEAGVILLVGSAHILVNPTTIRHTIVTDIYDKHLRKQDLSKKTKDFLYQKKRYDLDFIT